MSFTSVKTRLIQHYKCIGVNAHDSIRLASLIVKWVKKNGHEWTVKRLKDAQQAHRHSLQTGEPYTVPTGWAARRNRKGRVIYKDHIMHRMSTNIARAKLEQRLVFFRAHEVIKLPSETKTQYEKWISGVTPEYQDPPRTSQEVLRLSSIIDSMKLPVPSLDQRSEFIPMLYQGIREKTSPVTIDGRVFSAPRNCIEVYDIGPLRGPLWFHLVQKFPELTSECLTGNRNQHWYVNTILQNGPTDSTIGGTIGFIQEKSAKLRAVASPFLVYQAMGEPAKQQLSRLSKIIPEMFTHNQDAAKQLVAETLKTGSKVYGFDASAFTDRLPYDLQRSVLNRLKDLGWVTEFDCRVFDAMVESDWVLPSKFNKTRSLIRWCVGQPMGFGPSFHLAAITHYIILRCCAEKAGVKNYQNKFCVVGDDVSIFDDDIAREYLEVMSALGVDINLEKSVISDEVAEFCKKVILPGEVLESVTVQNNIRNKHSLAMAVDFYGRNLMKVLSKKQMQMADIVMLPVDMGGLGLSPPGMNYSEYVRQVLHTDNIRSYYLERELLDFYEVSTSDALKLTLLRTVERLDYWCSAYAYYCDSSFRVPVVPQDTAISEYTGLPATHRLPEDFTSKADGYRSPWLRVIDISIRSCLATGASELPSSSNVMFGRLGYIIDNEKAPLRPIITKEKVYDQPKNRLDETLERAKRGNFLKRRACRYDW